MRKDYYEILNINREAKPAEIKKAYRSAAKRHHPDISHSDEEKFKEIQEACETLADPEKRAIYDRKDLETPIYHTRRYRPAKPMDFSYNLLNGIEGLFPGFGNLWMSDIGDSWSEREKMRRSHSVDLAHSLTL